MTAIRDLFPKPINYLLEDARNKALEIMNALLAEGYETERATPIAATTAKKWQENLNNEDENRGTLHIVPHPRGWAIRRSNAERADFLVYWRNDAYDKAIKMVQKSSAMVMVHIE